jgi:hypothetical protein
MDPRLLEAVERWADDDLRGLNAQIEFLLRRAVGDGARDAWRRSGSATLIPLICR